MAPSGVSPPDTTSLSSSRARAVCPPPRFWAMSARRTLRARLRAIRPAKPFSERGCWGGMDCQHFSHVSLTHSSAAPRSSKMPLAMAAQ